MSMALIEELMKKSALCWLRYAGADRDHPVWHVWHEGAAYVVSGGDEQNLPGITEVAEAVVIARSKETRQRLLAWRARVETVSPFDSEWSDIAAVLQPKRLNAIDMAGLPGVWAHECTITRLTPTGEIVESPDEMPDADHAQAPPPTPAITRGKLPRVLHKRQAQRPKLR